MENLPTLRQLVLPVLLLVPLLPQMLMIQSLMTQSSG
jgi:hypothetical protein